MIFLLIGIIVLIIGLRNFKKGFYYFLFFKVCLVTNITIISIPGIPLLTLDLFMTIIFFILYYKKKYKLELDQNPFPYKKPFIGIAISYFISTLFAYIGFMSAFSQYIGQMITEFAFAWLMWKVVDKKNISFLLKGLTIMFFLSCVYAFYEKTTHTNPIQEYEASLVNDINKAINFLVSDDINRGYRVQSFFEHAIGAGINWAMYFIMYFSLTIYYKYNLKNKLSFFTALLYIPCLFFTNTRGPIVFCIISLFSLASLKNKRFYLGTFVGIIIAIIIIPYLSEYSNNLLSIFDSKAQEKVGGSNMEMRLDQLEASIALMLQSPFFGLGYKFMDILNNTLVDRLLGLESMWFRIFTQFGLIGAITNIILAYYSLVKIPMHYNSKPLFFISLAYWVTGSITSVPGMLIYLYYLIIIIFIKLSKNYNPINENTSFR